MPATIATLRTSPVKGLAQTAVHELVLDPGGLRDDRRFAVVEPGGLARYTVQLRRIAGTTASWDRDADVLELRFADGERVAAPVIEGEAVQAHGYGRRPMPGRLVEGPFAQALGARLGAAVRLVRLDVGIGGPGQITLLSLSSVERLAGLLGLSELDPRRFKMSIELAGLDPHEEDGWAGREVRIGEARVRIGGPVGRCALTTMDPDRLRRDHDVLRVLLDDRGPLPTGEPPFGMYAEVVQPGRVAVGDAVEPL